jgi:type II secretory pathway component PulM
MQITPRERWLSLGLAAALAVWAWYALAIQPARDRLRTLQRLIPAQQAQLRELQAQSARYTALRHEFVQRRTKMASQAPDFQLPAFLESVIARRQLAPHVAAMERDTVQPQPDYAQVVVTIELHDLSLQQLVDFLRDVETPAAVVRVASLHLRKDPSNEALLDATLSIASPTLTPPTPATQTAHNPGAGQEGLR